MALAIQIFVPLVLGLAALGDLRRRIRCDQGDFFDDDLPGGDGFGETYDDKCAGHEHGSFHDDSTILCTRRRDALYGRSMLIGVLAYCECLVVDWLNY